MAAYYNRGNDELKQSRESHAILRDLLLTGP
jgi:hypothetical protein